MNPSEETIRFYDRMAKQIFNDWFDNDALLPTLNEFIYLLPQKPKVLDLGCGTGGESKRVMKLGADVIGIDLSKESIKFAKENIKEANFYVMNILEMTFDDRYFHGVFEAGVLFHFTEKEQIIILGNIHKILKDDGVFLSYYPEGNYEGMEEFNIDGQIYSRYARKIKKDVWKLTVEESGFVFIKELSFNIGTFRPLVFKKD
jgi:2-polyprenyl-3-methyl-5-hydroxy-6-metoxy-1,4-benzoquinol methylase